MVKMGLIGAGTMGAMYALAYSQCESAEFVAVCDLNEKAARRLARRFGAREVYTDYRAMLRRADLEAVTVATPDFAHRAPVVAALKAGKDVLCEKPLATTVRDCDAICAAVAATGRKLMVNYGNRHKRQVYAIKERMAAGEIGPVENVFIRLREPVYKTRTLAWVDRTTPTFFLLSHCTDTVTYLLEEFPAEVYARATRGVLAQQGLKAPDAVVAVLSFDSGAVAVMDANWIMPEGFVPDIDFTLEVVGQTGAVYAKLRADDLFVYRKTAENLDYGLEAVDPLGAVRGWWYDSVYYFVECVARDARPQPDADQGARVTRVLLAVEESARRRRAVRL